MQLCYTVLNKYFISIGLEEKHETKDAEYAGHAAGYQTTG